MESAFTDVSYDDNVFMHLFQECSNYEELKLQCDMHSIECIMTEAEFKENMASRPWKSRKDISVSFL